MSPRVKICGICRARDARLALEAGAWRLGCVLAQDSPRRTTLARARELAVVFPERVVLVFRDPALDDVLHAARTARTDQVQVHGVDESFYQALDQQGLRAWRVHPVARDATRLPRLEPRPSEDRPAVLDVGRGGTGERFAWDLLRRGAPHATLIAGGVSPDNVRALLHHRPWGIDVSSGVEESPGRKDARKLRALFEQLEKGPCPS